MFLCECRDSELELWLSADRWVLMSLVDQTDLLSLHSTRFPLVCPVTQKYDKVIITRQDIGINHVIIIIESMSLLSA